MSGTQVREPQHIDERNRLRAERASAIGRWHADICGDDCFCLHHILISKLFVVRSRSRPHWCCVDLLLRLSDCFAVWYDAHNRNRRYTQILSYIDLISHRVRRKRRIAKKTLINSAEAPRVAWRPDVAGQLRRQHYKLQIWPTLYCCILRLGRI